MQRKFTLFLLGCAAFLLFVTPAFASTLPVLPATGPAPASVKSALAEFNSLSKKDKKARVSAAKKVLKEAKAAKRAGAPANTNTVLLVILAILLPPLAVYLHEGEINTKFWIDLVLTLLFFVPGVIYALIVVLNNGQL